MSYRSEGTRVTGVEGSVGESSTDAETHEVDGLGVERPYPPAYQSCTWPSLNRRTVQESMNYQNQKQYATARTHLTADEWDDEVDVRVGWLVVRSYSLAASQGEMSLYLARSASCSACHPLCALREREMEAAAAAVVMRIGTV